jgi:hypothetical protein
MISSSSVFSKKKLTDFDCANREQLKDTIVAIFGEIGKKDSRSCLRFMDQNGSSR